MIVRTTCQSEQRTPKPSKTSLPRDVKNEIRRLKQSGPKNSRLFSSPTLRGHFGLCRTSLNSSSQSRPSRMKKKRNNPKTLALMGERENWMFLCAAQTRGLDWPYQLLGFKEHRQSGPGRQSTHRNPPFTALNPEAAAMLSSSRTD